MALEIIRLATSQTPIGLTPGLLSSAISLQANSGARPSGKPAYIIGKPAYIIVKPAYIESYVSSKVIIRLHFCVRVSVCFLQVLFSSNTINTVSEQNAIIYISTIFIKSKLISEP